MKKATMKVLGETTGPTRFAFEAMDVAEAELRRRYPTKADEPAGAFLACRPRYEVFQGRTAILPGHMREILDRLDRGEDIRPGTAAECAVALSETALKAPLRHEWYLAFAKAFVDAVGDAKALAVLGDVSHDLSGYDRSVLAQEALAETRARLADPERGV